MQIGEGVAWNNVQTGSDITTASRTTMLLNIFQPVALLCVLWIGMRVRAWVATAAVLMYVLLMATNASDLWSEAASIAPVDGCSQLNLGWWNGARSTLYVVASLYAFLAIPSILWVVTNSLIFLVTLVVAVIAYPCGGGSVWCWLIFLASPILCAVDVYARMMRLTDPAIKLYKQLSTIVF